MKRFWLFAGAVYYPGGGMSDFQGDFDSLDEAMDHFKTFPKGKFDTTSGMWVHVFDSAYGVVAGDLDQWNSESLIDGNKLKIRGELPIFEKPKQDRRTVYGHGDD